MAGDLKDILKEVREKHSHYRVGEGSEKVHYFTVGNG